ncbi:filamentous hemagglutinin N-terminal domain-containing protein [Cupriavidus necator]|uniref:two-partner secretion domain-containing protein n=1 Tax=Cupriavidus necator TaxID=106590 RepID=UPI00339D6BC6
MHRDRPATLSSATSQSADLPDMGSEELSMAERGRRSVFARTLAGVVAVTVWLGPLQVSLQQAKQAAGVLAAGASDPASLAIQSGAVRQGLLRWAMNHLPVTVSFGPTATLAAPITDPNAPVRFTPTLTTTTGAGAPEGGVPVVGITTPNAQGISLNQYRSFVVDPIGLILNNSTTGGGTFLGGQVGANLNLAATGPANLIINQVTSQTPAQINGTVEVFGAPAGVVIAAPGGVYTSGAGFTNTTQVTLTTGTPQFLSTAGTATSFDAAAAVGFLVEGGRVQIANPTLGNPNGVGIEGTVGNINLIAESIGVDGTLYAGNQINLVAGRQLVVPANGTFATAATGPNNATTNTTVTNGLAIDATAFGAMTAGQIKIVSTAAGVGVRTDGNLAASAGNLTIDSAGNLKVGNTYAKEAVRLNAAGNVTASGNGQGEGGYAINAGRDVSLGGALDSGKAVAVSAGGSIVGAGGVKAQEAVMLAAGGSVDVGGAVSGSQVTVSAAGNDGSGDIRLGGDVTSPGAIQLNAARDTTINGSVVSASDLNLSTQRNLTINGAAGSTGGNVSLTGVTGSVTTAGNVVSPGSLTVTAGTDAYLGGQVLASGPVSVTAQTGSITTSGQIGSKANLTLTAAQNVTIGGQAQSAGNTAITATGGSALINGTLTSDGDTTITAGGDATVAGSLSSGGNTAIQANGGSATVNGTLQSMGDATVSGGQNATLAGSVLTGGNLSASAGQTLNVAGLDWVGGNATLRGGSVVIVSASGATNVVNGTLDAAATGSLALTGDTQATNVSLVGATVSNIGTTVATQQLSVAGGAVTNTGLLVGNQVSVNASDLTNRGTLGGQTATVNVANSLDNAQGLLVGAQSLNVTTGTLVSNTGGTIFAGDVSGQSPTTGDLAFTVTGGDGSFNNAAGQLLAGSNLTLNTPNQTFDPSGAATGTLNANGTMTLAALAIRNTGTWDVPGSNVVLQASQGISNTGTIQKAGDLTLATAGTLDNSGQIVGGSNLTLSAGTLTNTGTVHANGNLALSGNVVNQGTAEALGDITITGANYDNRGGTTQAGGDINVDIAGTLNNIGSVIGANGNIHIAAQQVINDRTAPIDAGSSTVKAANDSLLGTTVIGSYIPWVSCGSGDACSGYVQGTVQSITLADVMRKSDGSVPLAFGPERIYVGAEGSASEGYYWHLLPANTDPTAVPYLADLPSIAGVPTIDRTTVRQADGTAGQIIAGGNLDISAASLSNKGGVISAGQNVALNAGSLENGRSATLVNSVTDTVNQTELSAFLAQLQYYSEKRTGPLWSESGPLVYGVPPSMDNCDSCTAPPPWSEIYLAGTVTGPQANAPTQATVSYQLGKAGHISAGGNLSLTGTGDLTNAGDLAALGKIAITTPGTFTNQGTYDSKVTTTTGCVDGASDCPGDTNPHVDTLAWQQTPNTVAAGQALTITAANIQNLNGTLAAQGDVSLTATNSVTNQAGAIQSLAGDVSITAPTLVNKTMDPVKLHKSYGGQNPPYAGGCNPAGTYGNSQCAADEDTEAGPAGVISAARDVNLSGTTLTNNGALITGGRNVTVNMTGAVDNSSIPLNADWVGHWQEDRTGGDRWHDTSGRATIGSLESGIQAGNALSVSASGHVLNTGNLMGSMVDVSASALVNGYTSPNQPTPPSTAAKQVIPLGPAPVPAGSVPAATPVINPTQPWQFNPVIVATPSVPTTGTATRVDWHFNANLGGNAVTSPTATGDRAPYLNVSPATAVLTGVTPDYLLSQLPAELRPGSVSFYYDPYTEGQKLQQAALQQTGQASFINGLAWDNQYQLSVTDQEKLILYRNAADYAKEHNLALGTALTQRQINELDKPLLWYVEQAVPDQNCNAIAGAACPSVNALVPQVYLPEGYAQALTKPTGGTITGENISLDVAGQLRNSGVISAADTLNVKAGSIDAAPNVVDIGTSAYRVQGGWNVLTGTVVQPGGFMNAMHMNIEADAINAVNDAFLVRNADGTVDEAATLAFVNQLKANLGVEYAAETVADDIHTQFIKEKKGFGPLVQIVAMVAAVVVSIVTAGAAAAVIGVALAEMTLAQAMVVAALSSMAGSLASQLVTGRVDFGKIAVAGLVGAATAGLTNGITFDGTSFGVNGFDTVLKGTNSLANLAGTNTLGGVLQAAQDGASSTIAQQAVGMVGTGLINATLSTVAYGGGFGKALAGNLVAQAGALGANEIGATTDALSWQNIAEHAVLGCAAGAASGANCQSGAIGGVTGAVVSPLVGGALGIGTNADRANPVNQVVVTAAAMLAGGALANTLGQNGIAAAVAAQNEAANNYLSPKDRLAFEKAKRECANGVLSSCATANIYAATDQKSNDILAAGLTSCEGSRCQSLANWIQDQKTAYGCGSAAGSVDCQVLDKSWQIAQAKAQGLELPAFSPDDLIGTGLLKGALKGTLKGSALLGATRSVGNDAAKALEGQFTTLYRAVSPEEYHSIMKSGQFNFGPAGSEMKQFGFNLNEVLTYANFSTDYAALVKVTIPSNAIYNFGVSKNIDPFIFRSGVLTVNGKRGLDLFNSVVKNVDHAY